MVRLESAPAFLRSRFATWTFLAALRTLCRDPPPPFESSCSTAGLEMLDARLEKATLQRLESSSESCASESSSRNGSSCDACAGARGEEAGEAADGCCDARHMPGEVG